MPSLIEFFLRDSGNVGEDFFRCRMLAPSAFGSNKLLLICLCIFVAISLTPGLPDGTFPNQKSQFG
jgi:hypothetical protein